MMYLMLCLIICFVVPFNFGLLNATTKQKVKEDYYLNYDYELTNNFSEDDNFEVQSDSLIFPNPKLVESKDPTDTLPSIELPDDSLADSDLRGHDIIDNLMYIYYGSHNRIDRSYGSEIIILGSLLSCVAQLVTFCWVVLKKSFNAGKEISRLFMSLILCLCLSNLVFVLGVYSTDDTFKCQFVAVLLHYLYMLTSVWIFMYCYYIYKTAINRRPPNFHILITISYAFPGLFTLVSAMWAPRKYETKKFCFVSVEKGMLVNYMIPVTVLMIGTTLYVVNGVRKINMELSKLESTSDAESPNVFRCEVETTESGDKKPEMYDEATCLRQCKECLKALSIIQTSYDVVWFTAVLALENVSYGSILPISYTLFSLLLNWFIFARSSLFLPNVITYNKLLTVCIEDGLSIDKATFCFTKGADDIPLLMKEGYMEIRQLRLDTISTISN